MAAPSTPTWVSDIEGFKLYDGTQNNYGAPSGAGVVIEIGHGPTAGSPASGFFRGVVTASKLQGIAGGAGGAGARMWLDFTAGDPFMSPAGATPGVSPYWAIADNNGVVRVEAGYLAALGVSPLQWGMRVNDANHNPIWDALGLIGVNPVATLLDGYPAFINTLKPIMTIPLPTVAHAGTSFFVIAQVDLVATEGGAIGDTLILSITLDGGQAGLAGEPMVGVAAAPPFTNRDFPMGVIFWSFSVPDTKPHTLTVMAGSSSGIAAINLANTQQVNQSNVRISILQLGN